MAGLFLSIKQVQLLTDLGETAAQSRLAAVRKAYQIGKYQQVNVMEYCRFYRLDVEVVLKLLNGRAK